MNPTLEVRCYQRTTRWRSSHWRGLAYTGFRQKPDDGFLHGSHCFASRHGKPNHRPHHRSQTTWTVSCLGRSRRKELLRQIPVQAESRDDLAKILRTSASGGILFTTIQKFLLPPRPLGEGTRGEAGVLSERRNIVVVADEAHRSQYDFIKGDACVDAGRPAERFFHRVYRYAD